MYFLIFSLHYDRDSGLDWGRLSFNWIEIEAENSRTLNCWQATSSTATKQGLESFHQRGGLIPPQYRVPGLGAWRVRTAPIAMPNVRGVEGNFYKIEPFEVLTDKGSARGDFGIHLDANAPGSLGCIVLSADRFEEFQKKMDAIAAEYPLIPLFVQYS